MDFKFELFYIAKTIITVEPEYMGSVGVCPVFDDEQKAIEYAKEHGGDGAITVAIKVKKRSDLNDNKGN
jgi:hypothetical protein